MPDEPDLATEFAVAPEASSEASIPEVEAPDPDASPDAEAPPADEAPSGESDPAPTVAEQIREALGQDPEQFRRVLGHIPNMQSQLAKHDSALGTDDLRNELAALREANTAMYGALADSDILDESSRTKFRALADGAKATAEKADLIKEVMERVAPPTSNGNGAGFEDPAWAAASNKAANYAQSKGLDPGAIPENIRTQAIQAGDPIDAFMVVRDWADEQVESASAKRLNDRKAAAGKSPPSSGAAGDTTADQAAYLDGAESDTQRARLMAEALKAFS